MYWENNKKWEEDLTKFKETEYKELEMWDKLTRKEKIKGIMNNMEQNEQTNNMVDEREEDFSARGVQDRKDTLPTKSLEDEEGLMVLAEEETHPNGKSPKKNIPQKITQNTPTFPPGSNQMRKLDH